MKPKVSVTKSVWGVVHKMGPDQADLNAGGAGKKAKRKKLRPCVTV